MPKADYDNPFEHTRNPEHPPIHHAPSTYSSPDDRRERLMPQREPNLIEGDWETIDRRLTFGYVDPSGGWVPGILENIRNLQLTVAKNTTNESKIFRYILYFVSLVTAIRFLGIESVQQIISLFAHSAH